LLVRDGDALARAHRSEADYLQDFDALGRTGEPPSPSDYSPELSRDFRGLRLWLPLILHGAAAFRDALDEKLALTHRFHDGLRARIEAGAPLEIVAAPQLSTVAFRLRRRPGEGLDVFNHRNAALLAGINAGDHAYLSSTNLPVEDGAAFTLRVCVLSFRTHAQIIDACLADIDAVLAQMPAAEV
jgi:aromatic-L-amino-acid decarboxylase